MQIRSLTDTIQTKLSFTLAMATISVKFWFVVSVIGLDTKRKGLILAHIAMLQLKRRKCLDLGDLLLSVVMM